MSKRKVIPEYIYCPRCGSQIELEEDNNPQTQAKLKEQGYGAMARGICRCGVVAVLCWQPLPASPTFSLFFDIYPAEITRKILIKRLQNIHVSE